jgi:hypothetical protein
LGTDRLVQVGPFPPRGVCLMAGAAEDIGAPQFVPALDYFNGDPAVQTWTYKLDKAP